jgi:hypothetical protein
LGKMVPENDHISVSAVDDSAAHLLTFVKKHGLEGVVAKRSDGVYEPGKRSGSWSKYRLNAGQEFVVGGYTPGTSGFDALIVGFYEGKDLMFAARVRAGFVPATRREVFAQIKHLKTGECPFANLPEKSGGRWGQGLTAVWINSRPRKTMGYCWHGSVAWRVRPSGEFITASGVDRDKHLAMVRALHRGNPRPETVSAKAPASL